MDICFAFIKKICRKNLLNLHTKGLIAAEKPVKEI